MKKALNITWSVLQVLIIIYVISIISFMFFSNKYGYSQIGKYVIDVDNNEFLVIKKTNDIETGDLVYYYSIVNEKYKIVYSNVKSINEDKTYTLDNGDKILKTKIIGKTDRKIPVIGFILNGVKEKVNFLLFVLFPIVFVFVYQVYKFVIGVPFENIEE
jgi:hypothetical protein